MSEDYFNSLAKFFTGASRQRISRANLAKAKIPLPPIEVQKRLVAEAEREAEAIVVNRRLIETMGRRIAEVLSET